MEKVINLKIGGSLIVMPKLHKALDKTIRSQITEMIWAAMETKLDKGKGYKIEIICEEL